MHTFFLLAILLTGRPPGDPCHNPALVVDESATSITYHGCWQVAYFVDEAFPAIGLTARLSNALFSGGWRKLEADPFEPDASAGKVHVWTEQRLDDRAHTRVDSWIGWFVRDDESRLQVSLQYFGRPIDNRGVRPVFVRVTFITPGEWEKRRR